MHILNEIEKIWETAASPIPPPPSSSFLLHAHQTLLERSQQNVHKCLELPIGEQLSCEA